MNQRAIVLGLVVVALSFVSPASADVIHLSCDPQNAQNASRQDYTFDLGASTVSLDTARLGRLTFPLNVSADELSWTETYDVPSFPGGHFYAFNRLDRNSGTLHAATGPTNPPTTAYVDYLCKKSKPVL